MTINELRSIEKGRRNIDGYKNKSNTKLGDLFTKTQRSEIPIPIPRSKVFKHIPLPRLKIHIPLPRPIPEPRTENPYLH